MVRIVNYQKRMSENNKEFFVLEIQSGVTMVKSKETGKFYATANKATISSTFDEITCKALIGTEMPGTIAKVACEPYEYVIKDTGEVITLHHRFEYVDEVEAATPAVEKSEFTVEELVGNIPLRNSFSSNGVLQH